MEYPKVKMCNCGLLPRHAHIWLGSHLKVGVAFASKVEGIQRAENCNRAGLVGPDVIGNLCRNICMLSLPDNLEKDIGFNH